MDAVLVWGYYLMSTGSKTVAELSAYHHGLVDPPVLTTDRAPALTTPNLHQHLHASLWWNSSTRKPHLEINYVKGIKLMMHYMWKQKLSVCLVMK